MVDKIIFTVTPIFSIPPRGAAAVETWMYQVRYYVALVRALGGGHLLLQAMGEG